jgi:hypothetical protein
MREPILSNAFGQLSADTIGDPQVWIERREDLPEEARPAATRSVIQAWAVNDPHAAAAWAGTLPPGDERQAGFAAVVHGWAVDDPRAASEWVAGLPEGGERDAGAVALAQQIAGEMPAEAWHWATSVSDPDRRRAGAADLIRRLAATQQGGGIDLESWIDASALPPTDKQALRAQLVELRAGTGARTPPQL